jgi:hypothetical protein
MTTTGAGPLADVGTLVFDVLGTVVDEAGSVAAETARALAAAGAGPPWPGRVAAEWAHRVEALTGQIDVHATDLADLAAQLIPAR